MSRAGRAVYAALLRQAVADALQGGATAALLAYVWPDMTARFARLHGAQEIAAMVAARLDEANLLAWLRMEPGGAAADAEVRLRTWPGGEERLLATARFHGAPVHWLAAP